MPEVMGLLLCRVQALLHNEMNLTTILRKACAASRLRPERGHELMIVGLDGFFFLRRSYILFIYLYLLID